VQDRTGVLVEDGVGQVLPDVERHHLAQLLAEGHAGEKVLHQFGHASAGVAEDLLPDRAPPGEMWPLASKII
jgi:hypothetical protein